MVEGKQIDQPSVTTLVEGPAVFQVANDQRQSEYDRLKQEFHAAKQRLQEFVTRDKRQRQAERVQARRG